MVRDESQGVPLLWRFFAFKNICMSYFYCIRLWCTWSRCRWCRSAPPCRWAWPQWPPHWWGPPRTRPYPGGVTGQEYHNSSFGAVFEKNLKIHKKMFYYSRLFFRIRKAFFLRSLIFLWTKKEEKSVQHVQYSLTPAWMPNRTDDPSGSLPSRV